MEFSSLLSIDIAGVVAGFVFSMLIFMSGVGAGVLVVPSLIVLFGMDPTLAVATVGNSGRLGAGNTLVRRI